MSHKPAIGAAVHFADLYAVDATIIATIVTTVTVSIDSTFQPTFFEAFLSALDSPISSADVTALVFSHKQTFPSAHKWAHLVAFFAPVVAAFCATSKISY